MAMLVSLLVAGGDRTKTSVALAVIAISFATFSIKKRRNIRNNRTNKTTQLVSSKIVGDRDQLKSQLKSLLSKYNGCTKQKDVVEVVEKLAALNPICKDCSKTDLFQGE